MKDKQGVDESLIKEVPEVQEPIKAEAVSDATIPSVPMSLVPTLTVPSQALSSTPKNKGLFLRFKQYINTHSFESKMKIIGVVAAFLIGFSIPFFAGAPMLMVLGLGLGAALFMYGITALLIKSPRPYDLREKILFGKKEEQAELIQPDIKMSLKDILISVKKGDIDGLCDAMNNSPHKTQLIANSFSKLSTQEKIELLTTPCFSKSYTVWTLLMREAEKNEAIFQALFKDLSSAERLKVFCSKTHPILWYSGWKTTPNLIQILFEEMTPEDRLRLLNTKTDLGATFWFQCLNTTDINTPLAWEALETLIPILLKDQSPAEIQTLLSQSTRLALGEVLQYKVSELKSYTVLQRALLNPQSDKLVSILIKLGALEADNDFDFTSLLERPGVDITPYRDKIKVGLNSTSVTVDAVKELMADYITGPSQKKK